MTTFLPNQKWRLSFPLREIVASTKRTFMRLVFFLNLSLVFLEEKKRKSILLCHTLYYIYIELTQQGGRGKRTANLVWQTDLFVKDQKTLMLREDHNKTRSLVTFIAHKRFAVLLRKLTNCCVQNLSFKFHRKLSLIWEALPNTRHSLSPAILIQGFLKSV